MALMEEIRSTDGYKGGSRLASISRTTVEESTYPVQLESCRRKRIGESRDQDWLHRRRELGLHQRSARQGASSSKRLLSDSQCEFVGECVNPGRRQGCGDGDGDGGDGDDGGDDKKGNS